MSLHLLYDGAVSVHFDEAKHVYRVDNEVVENASSVLDIMSKPMLLDWAGKEAIKAFKQASGKYGVAGRKEQDDAARAHREVRNAAARTGSSAHSWIERYILEQITGQLQLLKDPSDKKACSITKKFVAWAKQSSIEWLACERVVYSKKYGYVGTCDALCKLDGKLIALDFKTGSGVYTEAILQITAYLAALCEELAEYKEAERAILHIPASGTKVYWFDEQRMKDMTGSSRDEDLAAFLYLLGVLRWKQKNSDYWRWKKGLR
jgi:hypothetical protein